MSEPSPQPRSSTRLPSGTSEMTSCRSARNRSADVIAHHPHPVAAPAAAARLEQRARQERLDVAALLLGLEQERVVAVGAGYLGEADLAARATDRIDEALDLVGREQPVAGEREQQEAHGRLGQRRGHGVVTGREVEVVHRLGHVEVGVGVEALDELAALVREVALDLELGDEVEREVVSVTQPPAELLAHRLVREVRDVADHARDRQSLLRLGAAVVVAAREVPGRRGSPGDRPR